jgi:hypothetical protein
LPETPGSAHHIQRSGFFSKGLIELRLVRVGLKSLTFIVGHSPRVLFIGE